MPASPVTSQPAKAASPHWARSVGVAAIWTLTQHASFFACAWWVSWWLGAERFGAFGQGLALSAMLSAAITLRLEYAGQLERRARRAVSLFALAERSAWVICAALLLVLALVHQVRAVPLWLWASALALAPQAGVLVRAAAVARSGNVVRAAALRSGPALVMIVILVIAWAVDWQAGVEWSIPLSASICWLAVQVLQRKGQPALRKMPSAPLARFHWPFVRAELPGFLLNVVANHGQVLLIGAFGGDAAAGIAALALRIAMLPTSVFGLALAERLRSRVVALGPSGDVLGVIQLAIRRMTALSLAAHLLAAVLVPLLLPLVFPAQGRALVVMVMCLLPLGAIRLVASPLACMLPLRGWLLASLLGQIMLFGLAVSSVVLAYPIGGLTAVATVYALGAGGIYIWYIAMALKVARADAI